MLSSSDAITFHCPLTDETEHMVNADTISRMKDGVFLINTARGGLVNEADLAAALKSGKVAGAGVDVISEEPMKPDNPLLTAPNILITPHIAWASIEARTRLVNQIAGNLSAWLEGRPVNVVS
jgi:glycerate dehydrogenase